MKKIILLVFVVFALSNCQDKKVPGITIVTTEEKQILQDLETVQLIEKDI